MKMGKWRLRGSLGLLLLVGCTRPQESEQAVPPPSPPPVTEEVKETGDSGVDYWNGLEPPERRRAAPADLQREFSPPLARPGQKIVVAMIPKLKGIDYFNACEIGAKEAVQELGNIELIYDGPTEAKEDKQNEMIDAFIAQQVNVIAIAANDPDAVAPYLHKARKAGILVITWDADAHPEKSGRQFFVNQAPVEAVARTLVDVMAEEAGPEAKTAIITSTLTAPNQVAWLREMKPYMQEKYPKMQVLAVKAPGEDQQRAMQMTQDVLKAYPEVQGIWGLSSVAFPGAAQAVQQSGKSGQVVVTGLSTPANMRSFVKNGTVQTVVLWNPVDLGYLTVYVARALADGTLQRGATSLQAGRLKSREVREDEVLLGDPLRFTAENIDQYSF